MATFTNQATLSYSGMTISSNIVTGERLEALRLSKTAVGSTYGADGTVTYVINLVNEGTSDFTNLTLTDDLGAYICGAGTNTPLTYSPDSLLYFINGELQPTPAVSAGPPLRIRCIQVPAEGNTTLVYKTAVNAFAPVEAGSTITNTADVSGAGLTRPISASETVTAEETVSLMITKAVMPTEVIGDEELTYTFIIQNTGNTEAGLDENIILRDTFDPILTNISVTYNGVPWQSPTQYMYNEITGEFASANGQITVPAATFTQEACGAYAVTPGTSTVTVTGTIA